MALKGGGVEDVEAHDSGARCRSSGGDGVGDAVEVFRQALGTGGRHRQAVVEGVVGDGSGHGLDGADELIQQGQQMDNAWELEQIKNSGWKDEFVLLLLSIPLVMSFIPKMQPYVVEGFAALSTTPEWYQWLILAVFTAVYGIRVWRRK